MRDMMEENYKKWHQHNEQQLAAHVQVRCGGARATLCGALCVCVCVCVCVHTARSSC
jgi:hypothetical protein